MFKQQLIIRSSVCWSAKWRKVLLTTNMDQDEEQFITYIANRKVPEKSFYTLPWGQVVMMGCDQEGELLSFKNDKQYRNYPGNLWNSVLKSTRVVLIAWWVRIMKILMSCHGIGSQLQVKKSVVTIWKNWPTMSIARNMGKIGLQYYSPSREPWTPHNGLQQWRPIVSVFLRG